MAETIIVIPNHLPHLDFLNEWSKVFHDKEIIIVQDIGDKPKIPMPYTNLTIYDHNDIHDDLGADDWIIPTRSSACRSYGFYKAWQRGAKQILTLDNDCFPDGSDFFNGHIENLSRRVTLGWSVSNSQFAFTRGFPYGLREKSPVGVSHGLWSMVPDLDAATSLHNFDLRFQPSTELIVIPKNNYYTMCGMNLAWVSELTPLMYFGLFGPEYGFDQYDDIWAGVLSKKVMDHLDYGVISGYPSVQHRKQSNVFINLNKQAPGLAMNEIFWEIVDGIKLTKNSAAECYEELISSLPDVIANEPEGWTRKFKQAALIWVNLFKEN